MAKRIVTKIGDVFSVVIDGEYKAFFQFICIDRSNMNSDTIRVFKSKYAIDSTPRIEDIVKDDVLFYSHTILRHGMAEGCWVKVGKSAELGLYGLYGIWFGQVSDRIYSQSNGWRGTTIDPLKNWTIWKVNCERINCGVLPESLDSIIEPPAIYNYNTINQRIKYGYFLCTETIYDIIKRVPRKEVSSYTRIVNHGKEVFYHFIGENLVRMISKDSTGRFVKNTLTDGDAIKFWDINWLYRNFISEGSFNNLWNSLDY